MFILAHYSIKSPTNTIIPGLIYGFGANNDELAFFSFKSTLSIDTSYVFKTYINFRF